MWKKIKLNFYYAHLGWYRSNAMNGVHLMHVARAEIIINNHSIFNYRPFISGSPLNHTFMICSINTHRMICCKHIPFFWEAINTIICGRTCAHCRNHTRRIVRLEISCFWTMVFLTWIRLIAGARQKENELLNRHDFLIWIWLFATNRF